MTEGVYGRLCRKRLQRGQQNRMSCRRELLPLVISPPPPPLQVVPRCRPRAFRDTLRSDAILPVSSFALQKASVLLRRRLPLASEDAAYRLRADAKLVGENGRGERVRVVRVQRAQAVHRGAGKLVRWRPPLGEFCFHGGAVVRPSRGSGIGLGRVVVRLVSHLFLLLYVVFFVWLLFGKRGWPRQMSSDAPVPVSQRGRRVPGAIRAYKANF